MRSWRDREDIDHHSLGASSLLTNLNGLLVSVEKFVQMK